MNTKSLNQLEIEALRAATGSTIYNLHDLRVSYYQSQTGLATTSMYDLQKAFLQSATGLTYDSLEDLWRAYLIGRGVTETISTGDMLRDFYINTGFSSLTIKTGKYTGNGTDDRNVDVGLDLTGPNTLVIIWSPANQNRVYRTDRHTGDSCSYLTVNAVNATNELQGFNSTGFQVGTGARVNTNAVVYYYLIITDLTGQYFRTGSYVGDGNDNRSVVIESGWSPSFVHIKQQGTTDAAQYKTTLHTGEAAGRFGFFADVATNTIQAINANGFQIGSDVAINRGGNTFFYFALKAVPGLFEVLTYTGNGSDNRNVNYATLVSPTMVWVDAMDTSSNRTAQMATTNNVNADQSLSFANVAAAANMIQSVGASSFQVGTDTNVNNNTTPYLAWIFKDGTA